MQNSRTVTWNLKKGSDRRIKAGHPWVYSNELQESPKNILANDTVKLLDSSGNFVAYGFGNPQSLIAFRKLSTVKDEKIETLEFFENKVKQALELRLLLNKTSASFRWIYGESDGLPGLVVDAYCQSPSQSWCLVVQIHSAGMEARLPLVTEAIYRVWNQHFPISSMPLVGVLRRDMSVRHLEGLEVFQEPSLLWTESVKKESLMETSILVAYGSLTCELTANLWDGQKTGFFLDQSGNIETFLQLIEKRWGKQVTSKTQKPLEVLDLCCHLGQWSVAIGSFLKQKGIPVKITAVDVSQEALQGAEKNFKHHQLDYRTLKLDVMNLEAGEKLLGTSQFDIVIADPPALIKSRKDFEPGKHGYLKLMTQALQWTRPEGLLCACSCSALLSESDFFEILNKAVQRSQRKVMWIGRGFHGVDHPVHSGFTEGQYLKSYIGFIQ